MKRISYFLFSMVFLTFFNLDIAAQVVQGTATISIDCDPGKLAGKNANGLLECVPEVKFFKWYDEAGFNLATAQDICNKNGWVIATAEEVKEAHAILALDQLSYGMLADGTFAVPVQRNHNFFKKGANIGSEGGNEGFFYVSNKAVTRAQSQPVTQGNSGPPIGGSINLSGTSPIPPTYIDSQNSPSPTVAVAMAHCSDPSTLNAPSKNWLMEQWPSPLSINASGSINILAAKTYLAAKKLPVNDDVLQQLVAAVKNDPAARYKFAPFLIKECFEALVTTRPNAAQVAYKNAFQNHQSCEDYNRAVITLDLWNNYQGQGSFGGPQAYAPNLLSNVNFSHRPSVDQFLQSDPLQYGPVGGATVALLFMPMAANAGILDDHPATGYFQLMDDDLTGIAVGAGLGTAVVTAYGILGTTVAYMTVVGANSVAAATSSLAASLALSQASLAVAIPGTDAALALTAEVASKSAAVAAASKSAASSFALTASNLVGPIIVAVAAAVILGKTIAEVAKTDAYEAKIREAANRVHNFKVSEFLNVPNSEMQTRKTALFSNVVKHLIAIPAQSGKLTLAIPSVLPGDVKTAAGIDKALETTIGTAKEVKFHAQDGITMAQAQSLASQNGWKIATSSEVQAAFQQYNLDVYAFGMMADGRFAVPVQKDHSNFKIGPNIGASGGNQGFFYVTTTAPVTNIMTPASPGYARIQNSWHLDHYIHNEKGLIEEGQIEPNWWSSQWKIVPAHSGWIRIQNKWKPDQYIHNQNGKLEVGPIDNNWQSAMWKLVPVHSGWVRIQNSWYLDHYIHNQNGKIEVGPIDNNWQSAMWKVE